MGKTKIEWADNSINPLQDTRKGKSGRGYHCTKVDQACLHCYAEVINNRFGNHYSFDDTPMEFEIMWSVLDKIRRIHKPKTVFVQSMGDLFHECVTSSQIHQILTALEMMPQHTLIFLTKRVERMCEETNWWAKLSRLERLPPTWIGMVTAGTQESADDRVPKLLQSRFQITGISAEPLLEAIDLTRIRVSSMEVLNALTGESSTPHSEPPKYSRLDQVIVGAETGPGKRPMDLDWARLPRDQCIASSTPFFFKRDSNGNRKLDGQLWEQMPGKTLAR